MSSSAAGSEREPVGCGCEGLRRQVVNLEIALESDRRIGMAIGGLMSRRKITEDAARELLRSASQDRHSTVFDVAEAVLLSGTVDQPAPLRLVPTSSAGSPRRQEKPDQVSTASP